VTTGGRPTARMHIGVSDIDIAAAKQGPMVVYALDSKYLHRANPNGSKNDTLRRDLDVLVDALEIFGGKPRHD